MPVLLWYAGTGVLFLRSDFCGIAFLTETQGKIRRGQAPTLPQVLRWKRVRNSGTDVQGSIGRAAGYTVEPWCVSRDAASGRRCL